jgi:hypothetical protein
MLGTSLVQRSKLFMLFMLFMLSCFHAFMPSIAEECRGEKESRLSHARRTRWVWFPAVRACRVRGGSPSPAIPSLRRWPQTAHLFGRGLWNSEHGGRGFRSCLAPSASHLTVSMGSESIGCQNYSRGDTASAGGGNLLHRLMSW